MSFWTDITLKEPLRQNRWYIIFGTPQLDEYRFALKECSKPEYTIDSVPLLLLNRTFNYPKNLVWKPITVKMVSAVGESILFEDRTVIHDNIVVKDTSEETSFENKKIESALPSFTANKTLEASILGTVFDMINSDIFDIDNQDISKNKKQLNIELIQVDANGIAIETWKLYNSFLSNVNYGTLTYANDEFVDITFTITYDYAGLNIAGDDIFEENDVLLGYDKIYEVNKRKQGVEYNRFVNKGGGNANFGYNGTQGEVVGSPGLPWQPSSDSETEE